MTIQIITRAEARAQGAKFYFTGKSCTRGHISERRAADCGCCACGKHYSNAWKAQNRERSREITNAWKAANPHAGTQWHQNNREKSQQAWRAYYQRKREWHCERVKPSANKHRAQKRGNGGRHRATSAFTVEPIFSR